MMLAMGILSHATDQTETSVVKKHIDEGENPLSSLERKNDEVEAKSTIGIGLTVELDRMSVYTFEPFIHRGSNDSKGEQNQDDKSPEERGNDGYENAYLQDVWDELNFYPEFDSSSNEDSFFAVLDAYELAGQDQNMTKMSG